MDLSRVCYSTDAADTNILVEVSELIKMKLVYVHTYGGGSGLSFSLQLRRQSKY